MTVSIAKKRISCWDWAGVFFSSLCLVHCVTTPILLASTALWIVSEWVHVGFLVLLIPITLIASRRSYRKPSVVVFLYAGLSILGAGLILSEVFGERFEVSTTILGSLLLIIGHLRNRHFHRDTPTP